MAVKSGVYPCYENQFAIGKSGTDTATTPIANCEEFSVAFDNGVEAVSYTHLVTKVYRLYQHNKCVG